MPRLGTLIAPRRGRIEYKLAQPGEVLAAGGRVLTLLDLGDLYLTIFLPAGEAGRLVLGDEARVVLDPVPEYVAPAKVTFIATEVQFTLIGLLHEGRTAELLTCDRVYLSLFGAER